MMTRIRKQHNRGSEGGGEHGHGPQGKEGGGNKGDGDGGNGGICGRGVRCEAEKWLTRAIKEWPASGLRIPPLPQPGPSPSPHLSPRSQRLPALSDFSRLLAALPVLRCRDDTSGVRGRCPRGTLVMPG